jgi:hypothetical protein
MYIQYKQGLFQSRLDPGFQAIFLFSADKNRAVNIAIESIVVLYWFPWKHIYSAGA